MRKIILLVALMTFSLVNGQFDPRCPEIISQMNYESCPNAIYVELAVTDMLGYSEVEIMVFEEGTTNETQHHIFTSSFDFATFGPYPPTNTTIRIEEVAHNVTTGETCSQTLWITFFGCPGVDNDGDGVEADRDCNDSASGIFPGAPEECDGIDNNCNFTIDEGVKTLYYYDEDEDGYGREDLRTLACEPVGFYTAENNLDCDDTNSAINPGALEACDGVDNNCDGTVDEGCSCNDGDGDGVCDVDDICPGFDDAVDGDSDSIPDGCDICPSLSNPGQEPDADCDGVLSTIDCDDSDDTVTTTNVDDADCDGVPTAEDCDDTDSNLGSNANDADCDGVSTAEDCNDNDAFITLRIGEDSDLDGVLDCNDAEVNSQCPLNVDNRGISLDSDNDGTLDCQDGCPGDRFKLEPGECGCDLQDSDTDGDEVLDCNDQEIRSRCLIVDDNGVSLDSDNDGVLDCDDLCPGFDDNLDVDRDKIPDGCDLDNTVRGVPICHVGNNGSTRTIYVSPQQKERHLAHGDEEGVCATANTSDSYRVENSGSDDQILIYPNPASTEVSIQVENGFSTNAVLSISDLHGNQLMVIPMAGNSLITIGLNNRFVPGMYFAVIIDGDKQISSQFLVSN